MIHDTEKLILKNIQDCFHLAFPDVLEIGCGNGRITQLLIPISKTITAIDPDKKLIENAKNNFKDVNFQVGNGENLNFNDNIFDIVIFSHSLHHQNSHKALGETRRVLKENGRVVILEPTFDGEVDKICRLFIDEDEQMNQARRNIFSSSFKVQLQKTFETDMIFDNREELYSEFCKYYGKSEDERIIERINEIIKTRINSLPVILNDKIFLVCLQK